MIVQSPVLNDLACLPLVLKLGRFMGPLFVLAMEGQILFHPGLYSSSKYLRDMENGLRHVHTLQPGKECPTPAAEGSTSHSWGSSVRRYGEQRLWSILA